MNDGAGVGLLIESMPLDKEKTFDFVPQNYIFSYGKIARYGGEYAKEMVKKGIGKGMIVAFWINDEDNTVEKVAPIIFGVR